MFQTRHKKAVAAAAAGGCNVDKKAERGAIERAKERKERERERPKGKVSDGYHRDVCKHGACGADGRQKKGERGTDRRNEGGSLEPIAFKNDTIGRICENICGVSSRD